MLRQLSRLHFLCAMTASHARAHPRGNRSLYRDWPGDAKAGRHRALAPVRLCWLGLGDVGPQSLDLRSDRFEIAASVSHQRDELNETEAQDDDGRQLEPVIADPGQHVVPPIARPIVTQQERQYSGRAASSLVARRL